MADVPDRGESRVEHLFRVSGALQGAEARRVHHLEHQILTSVPLHPHRDQEVRVRVEQAGHEDAVAQVDELKSVGDVQRRADGLDRIAPDQHRDRARRRAGYRIDHAARPEGVPGLSGQRGRHLEERGQDIHGHAGRATPTHHTTSASTRTAVTNCSSVR